ncbi:MAG: aminotransferase class V-fold PLP-dependent enzyme [Verrucomicrobia bacterium]|nr:aminotransferase class V-fold PLP-dependent enzyme [Verrucomicrobiota bacterium]
MSDLDPLAPLVIDESVRQRTFPITKKKIFLSHAAVTTLPEAVVRAMNEYNALWSTTFPDYPETLALIADAKKTAAELIRAEPDEIALLGPTSLGLNLFALGIRWQPGDEVICYFEDYPANVYPWLGLQSQGVEVRFLRTPNLGEITPEQIHAGLTPKTRLVALASCHFVSGYRLDLAAIGRLLHEREILFSVDAIQTLGAFPTTVEHVDFLSADAHKWLLGPVSIGVVFVRKDRFEICRPALLGSRNIKSPGLTAQVEMEFMPSAQRYEPGVLNMPGIVGMQAAMRLLLDAGIERVAERITGLRAYLGEGLRQLGFDQLGPTHPVNAAGILTVRHSRYDIPKLYERLTAADVVCSLRQDRQGNQYVRFSPHFYNTEAELDHVLKLIEKW